MKLAAAAKVWVTMSSVFLLTRSATTPAMGAKSSIGSVIETAVRPRADAESVSLNAR